MVAVFWFFSEDYPSLFGLYVPTYALRGRKLTVAAVVVITAVVFLAGDWEITEAMSVHFGASSTNINTAVVLLSSLIVIAVMKLFGLRGSFIYAFLGAAEACAAISGHRTGNALTLVISALAATAAAFIISAILSLIFKYTIAGKRVHLIRLATRMRNVIAILTVITAAAIGLNWGGFLSGAGLFISGIEMRNGLWYLAAIIPAIVLCSLFLTKITESYADRYYDFMLYNVLAAGISTSIVLIFFSCGGLCSSIGLTAMPLAAGSIVYASIAGTAVTLKQRLLETDEYLKEGLSVLVAPAGSMLLCYLILNFSGLNNHLGSRTVDMALTLTSAGVFAAIGIVSYLKKLQKQKVAAEKLVRSQQQQIYENSRALNDMEMKVVLSENQALHENLEIKRQEVMNVALSICEQREYLESLKSALKQIEETDDPKRKDELIAELSASVNQRLSYDRDVDTSYFYAKAEAVHEDFSKKLSEAYPDLTPQEKRLATLLRLGFSSKYIASLMNITPKSVEISRYRLRQKLSLGKGDNLVNFIQSI